MRLDKAIAITLALSAISLVIGLLWHLDRVAPLPKKPKWDTTVSGDPVLPGVAYPCLEIKDLAPERDGDLWKIVRLAAVNAVYQPSILIIEVFGHGLSELRVETIRGGKDVGFPDVQTSETRSTAIRLPYGSYRITIVASDPKVDITMRFE